MVVLQKIRRKQREREWSSQSFLDCYPKQLGNQCHLASHISFFHPLQVSFPDHVHHLEALYGSPGRQIREKAHPWLRQAFDEPMILFDQIVEVFHAASVHSLREDVLLS